MQARLFCRTGEFAGVDYQLAGEMTIGRHPDNQIILESDVIAQHHARIDFDTSQGRFLLERVDKHADIRLDGIPVEGKIRLDDLHVITLGRQHEFIFLGAQQFTSAGQAPTPAETLSGQLESIVPPSVLAVSGSARRRTAESRSSETLYAKLKRLALPSFLTRPSSGHQDQPPKQAPASTGTVAAKMEKIKPPVFQDAQPRRSPAPASQPTPQGELVRQSEKPLFLEVQLAGERTRFPITSGEHTVGRSSDCEIPLDHMSVSRKHALLKSIRGQLLVRDLNSVNRTYVNNELITDETKLKAGDVIRFGLVEARLTEAGPGREESGEGRQNE